MSLFPKNIMPGEKVLIHSKIENKSSNSIKLKIFLSILRPDKFVIKIFNGTKIKIKGKTIKNFYYFLNTTKKSMLGKYYVILNIELKNKLIESITKPTDFFLIEKIDIYYKNKNILIRNLSDEPSTIQLISKNKIQKKIIKKSLLIQKDKFIGLIFNKKLIDFKRAQRIR